MGSGMKPVHTYTAGGTYTVTLTVIDDGGLTGTDAAEITINEASATIAVFFDSFETSEWNGLWIEDSQNDWFRSTQRAVDGGYSAEIDGNASHATLTSVPVDLQGKTNVTITFSWFIERGLDRGEYLAFDVSIDGGGSWSEKASLNGNVDLENTWYEMSLEVTDIDSLRIRFRGNMSRSNEDANVDLVRVTAW
jgi:PKD repeat protein